LENGGALRLPEGRREGFDDAVDGAAVEEPRLAEPRHLRLAGGARAEVSRDGRRTVVAGKDAIHDLVGVRWRSSGFSSEVLQALAQLRAARKR